MLVWKFFKKQWLVQMAVVLLLASAIVVLALYGAYLTRQKDLLSVRLQSHIPEGYLLARQEHITPEPPYLPPHRGMREPPITLVTSWRTEVMPSSVGNVLFAFLTDGNTPEFELTPNTVAVPRSMANDLGLATGDEIAIKVQGGMRSLGVTHIHEGKIFGDSIVTYTSVPGGTNTYLYVEDPTETRTNINRYLSRVFPRGAIEDVDVTTQLAKEIVGANYSPGAKARVELITFITIAYLSTSLLAFLERRKVLAILKATGLRARELMSIIAGENIIAPTIAAVLGAILSTGILLWLQASGMGLSPSAGIIISAVLGIIPAVAVGVAVPARFTQMASVNQLLYERPIPLFYSQIRGLSRRYPAIEAEQARGVTFIKLDVVDGIFTGFIFRKVGDKVKAGEVLAVQHDLGGLRVRDYIAPVGGVIVRMQEETGFIGIVSEEQGGSE